MSPKKHSKQAKRDIGKGRPTENKALKGFTKGTVTKMSRALRESPDPEEELREMVVDCLSGDTRIEDLVESSKSAGLYGTLKTQLAEFNIHLSAGHTVGGKSSLQIVSEDSPLIPRGRTGQSELGRFDNVWGKEGYMVDH